MKELWVEKYRPDTIDGYVFTDDNQKAKVEEWIAHKEIPHILFSGGAGTGKTTLAKILVNAIDIDPSDFLEINASKINKVDDVRSKIEPFTLVQPRNNLRVVLLDEADYLTPNAQAALRGIIEGNSATCRFILTCNYPHKVIPALHSRCQGVPISEINIVEYTARVASILVKEDVEFDLDTVDDYVNTFYPDLRKCINEMQNNVTDGKLPPPRKNFGTDRFKEVTELFKEGKIREARKTLCANITSAEVDDVFRWMYDHLELWSDTEEGQDKAIIIIRDGLARTPFVADMEINLSGTFIELVNISE